VEVVAVLILHAPFQSQPWPMHCWHLTISQADASFSLLLVSLGHGQCVVYFLKSNKNYILNDFYLKIFFFIFKIYFDINPLKPIQKY
jgi:hypothetical protein